MILAIDIGNTHLVLGSLNENNEVVKQMKLSTDRVETTYEYAAEIKSILALEGLDPSMYEGAIISSVVPLVTKYVSQAVALLTGKRPLILGDNAKIDLPLDMNGLSHKDIAGDLLATAMAAKLYYSVPAVIIDIGTATTITAVSKAGAYIGGVILPGPNTAQMALVERAALLPAVDFLAPDQAIAKDTVNAMRGGIVFGSAGAIDGILDHFIEELGEMPMILATGGMGQLIVPHCRHEIIVDGELLLKGLGLIWQQNL